jgi:hypothetical protein
MKTILTTLCIISICSLSYSQIYEVGGFLGGSNFIGDVGSTQFIDPNSYAFGGVLKWNRSPRHSFRASLIFSTLSANDNSSDDPKRVNRGYYFDTNIIEASLGLEFTFFDFNLHSGTPQSSPYIYTGISMTNHPNFFFNNNLLIDEKTKSNAYGIPITLGFKTTLINQIVIAVELGARYTFSDEIDGSKPDSEENQIARFGNFNNNDWYMFSGLTITYTFGRKPCYCDF